jgi:hypothetical protein
MVTPGVNIYTTVKYTSKSTLTASGAGPGRYGLQTECATSWAAPQVTGLVALLLAYESDISFEDVRDKLIAAASQEDPDIHVGYGTIDAEALLDEYICPVKITGDVNQSGEITAADIVYLVNYVFNSGPTPLPCEAAGDANCSEAVTAADINYLATYVYQAGPEPCNVCELVDQGDWDCP